jgi:hypothetical protein
MTSPRYGTHYTVQGIHPDKKDPFDRFINYYPTREKAVAAKAEIEQQGFEHVTITPPAALKQLG